MQDLIDNWPEFEEKINRCLKILKSSDFHPKDGLNETSLKAILVQQLSNELNYEIEEDDNDVKIDSECYIKDDKDYTRYIDLLIEDANEKIAIIIELKYIRLTFLSNENKSKFVDRNFEDRRVLKDAIARFRGIDAKDVLKKMKKRETDGSYISIEHVLNDAFEQGKNYSTSNKFNRKKFDKVYVIACVGVVDKIFCKTEKIDK